MDRIAPYNKAVYGGLTVAITQIIVYVLAQYGIYPPSEVSASLTTIITAIVIFAVPNIEPEPEPVKPEQPRENA